MSGLLWTLVWVFGLGALAYHKPPKKFTTIILFGGLVLTILLSQLSLFPALLLCLPIFLFALILNFNSLRQRYLIPFLLHRFKEHPPKLSTSEQIALEAGTVWWDGELFSGNPNWEKLFKTPTVTLSEEEQIFLAGPVETLCQMIDDWEIARRKDIPAEIWQFLKEHRFFGLIIPQEFGGWGFGALAHSEILTKIASKSLTVSSTVSVPNSLGPAELLLHYGTPEQKEHFLPRLAKGLEIPCFALTNPEAGSDATAIPDKGVICSDFFKGKEILGIRLNWDKRYITLAPIATILGLTFRLYDPDHLIGDNTEIGMTCALIPTNTKGITIGLRHKVLSSPFQNGPTQGKDVFIPLDWIIGGPAMAGSGWRMLMECLSTGRAISLPAGSAGSMKFLAAATGSYAKIRRQFKHSIGWFEGIQEHLARIAGNAYLGDAARKLTASVIDQGEAPSVLGAIIKCHLTERARQVSMDAMDVYGGKAIMLGPRNIINAHYQSAPVTITVEGANILMRNLVIFGQGVIRCHPYLKQELKAISELEGQALNKEFDILFMQHLASALSNAIRAFWMGMSQTRLHHRKKDFTKMVTRASSAFAFVADVSMILFGGKLKFKEKISARLGDLLSMMYLASCAIKRFEDQGRQNADLPLLEWVIHDTLSTYWTQMSELLRNFPIRWIAWILQRIVMPFGKLVHKPNDKLENRVAEILLSSNPTRSRLIQGIHLTPDSNNRLAQLEIALQQVILAEDENASLDIKEKAEKFRREVIAVDQFAPSQF